MKMDLLPHPLPPVAGEASARTAGFKRAAPTVGGSSVFARRESRNNVRNAAARCSHHLVGQRRLGGSRRKELVSDHLPPRRFDGLERQNYDGQQGLHPVGQQDGRIRLVQKGVDQRRLPLQKVQASIFLSRSLWCVPLSLEKTREPPSLAFFAAGSTPSTATLCPSAASTAPKPTGPKRGS